MNEVWSFTEEEAHLHFAKSLNGEVWSLLQTGERTAADEERMLYAAHASAYHWLQVGTGLHHQRGEWLIAHVYTLLEMPDMALRHAARCLELAREHDSVLKDFDWAYAYEGMARAEALAGDEKRARRYLQQAQEAARAIRDEGDRALFMSDFHGGPWFGLMG